MTLRSRSQFDLLRKLGSGGFGEVLLMKKTIGGNCFAVKVVDLEKIREELRGSPQKLVDNLISMTTTEAEKMINLQHDNIIRVFGSFIEAIGGRDFYHMVMEYCPDGDLADAIEQQQGKPFEETKIQQWTGQIGSAILFLHEEGVVHRDIKPSNIFLLNNQQTAKLGDFGLAKETEQLSVKQPTKIATAIYCSPEYFDGEPNSPPNDVWAFGVVLCEVAALKYPFPLDSLRDFQRSLEKRPIAVIETLSYSKQLKDFIHAALTFKRRNRPSMAELLDMDFLISTDLLLLAVNVGDKAKAEKLLSHFEEKRLCDAKAWPITSGNPYGETALHLAALRGDLQIVKVLVKRCSEFQRVGNAEGQLAIHRAAMRNQQVIVEYFISHGEDINVTDVGTSKRTCLHYAACQGYRHLAEWLIANKADATLKSSQEDGENLPVHLAAKCGHLNVVKCFVERNLDLKYETNRDGNFPVHMAALGGHVSVIEYFLGLGMDVDVLDEGEAKRSCLHKAAERGHIDLVKWLISNKADVYLKSSPQDGGNLAVHLAAHYGHLNVVRIFVEMDPKLAVMKNGAKHAALKVAQLSGESDAQAVASWLKSNTGGLRRISSSLLQTLRRASNNNNHNNNNNNANHAETAPH